MKFFWKLYFSIMTITLICFSVGGTMLIQTSFKNSFDREVESIYQENDILVTLKLKPNKEIKMKRKHNNYNIELIFIENKETNGLYELKKYGNIPLTVFTKKLICDNHIYIEYYLNKQDELYKLNLFYEVK